MADHPARLERRPRVLIATDGSDASLTAAKTGYRLAAPESDVHLLTVVAPLTDPMETSTGFAGTLVTPEQAEHEHTEDVIAGHAALAATARAMGATPFAQHLIEDVSPGKAICRTADELDASMIVVGSHGHGWSEALLGSIGRHVMAHARQSVLVVPSGPASRRHR